MIDALIGMESNHYVVPNNVPTSDNIKHFSAIHDIRSRGTNVRSLQIKVAESLIGDRNYFRGIITEVDPWLKILFRE